MVGDYDNVGMDDCDVFATVLVVDMDIVSSEERVMVAFLQHSGGLRVKVKICSEASLLPIEKLVGFH